MKLYHFTIIFAVFAVLMLLTVNLALSEGSYMQEDTGFLNEACDRAADAGAAVLAKAGRLGVYGVREAAVDAFYESLAASLDVGGYAGSRMGLSMYVPLIVVKDEDSIYVCYDDYSADADGHTSLVRKWSGNIAGENLDEVLEEYCRLHNTVAERAGLNYEFFLPEDDGGMYLRGCEGTGFFVLFQGYPVNGLKETFNRFSFAGTGLDFAENYYINLQGTGLASPKYFHRKDCVYRAEESTVYSERRSCALAGAYECPECGGDGY